MSTSIPRHILVPHDFSDTAEKALSFAIDLASKLGARITVMHAFDVPTYGYSENMALTVEVVGSIRRAAQGALEAVAGRAQRPGLEVLPVIRQGAAWSEINSTAKERQADRLSWVRTAVTASREPCWGASQRRSSAPHHARC